VQDITFLEEEWSYHETTAMWRAVYGVSSSLKIPLIAGRVSICRKVVYEQSLGARALHR
jgi:hypothetical protein